MNEKDLQKFLPENAVFHASRMDGARGIFKLWYSTAENGVVNTVKFLRKNGHWVFQSDMNASLEH